MKILFCVIVFMVAACSSKEQEAKGVIPQAQLDALEKAKQVEDVLKETEQKRRAELEELDAK